MGLETLIEAADYLEYISEVEARERARARGGNNSDFGLPSQSQSPSHLTTPQVTTSNQNYCYYNRIAISPNGLCLHFPSPNNWLKPPIVSSPSPKPSAVTTLSPDKQPTFFSSPDLSSATSPSPNVTVAWGNQFRFHGLNGASPSNGTVFPENRFIFSSVSGHNPPSVTAVHENRLRSSSVSVSDDYPPNVTVVPDKRFRVSGVSDRSPPLCNVNVVSESRSGFSGVSGSQLSPPNVRAVVPENQFSQSVSFPGVTSTTANARAVSSEVPDVLNDHVRLEQNQNIVQLNYSPTNGHDHHYDHNTNARCRTSESSNSSSLTPPSKHSGNRQTHNKLEQSRRAHLRDCFESLKNQLPAFGDCGSKISNLTILRSSIRHIKDLRRTERECALQEKNLRHKRNGLEQRLSVLENGVLRKITRI